MPVHFVMCVHNHQPVGNFGFVIEKAYGQSYKPFMDVFRKYPSLKAVMHFSGVLYQWLEKNHRDFLDILAALADEDRIEFLSGGYYEPILAVIPEWDRTGQLEKMSGYIVERFGQEPKGLWLSERVWEPSLPGCITDAGLEYVVVDDYHLRAAGVSDHEITEPYLTDDGGKTIKIIGGSERLRYLIPFEEPDKTIAYLREIHLANPGENQLVTMADDGEKLGVWPGTHKKVYQEGWLDRFFKSLDKNSEWLKMCTYKEALAAVRTLKPVYLPTVSYMEMSEWALPPKAAYSYNLIKDAVNSREDLRHTTHLLRGGFWRNFLTKYPESRYLLGKMYYLSRKIKNLSEKTISRGSEASGLLTRAREELWRGQCNDAYWHGVFGGLYLPFLRSAVYEHLIRAETILDSLTDGEEDFISLDSVDLDGDGNEEVVINNRYITLTIDALSGIAVELDYKPKAINIFNSLVRREESYHQRILESSPTFEEREARSIHHIERLRDGQPPPRIVYDSYSRKSFVDHFWSGPYAYSDWRDGRMAGSWMDKKRYIDNISGADDRGMTLELISSGDDILDYNKKIFVDRAAPFIRSTLKFEIPSNSQRFFAGQEFNLTPTSVDKAVLEIIDIHGRVLNVQTNSGEFNDVSCLKITDSYKSYTITIKSVNPVNLWIAKLGTVSNSEGGYEEISQQLAFLFWCELSEKNKDVLDIFMKIT